MTDVDSAELRDRTWLRDRILDVLEFYYPACIADEREGYHHRFLADGTVEPSPEPLVGTCRFVYNFSVGAELEVDDSSRWAAAARHGIERLRTSFTDDRYGGFYWELDDGDPADATKYAYGHAFVLLAFARAAKADVANTEADIASVYDVLERRFYEPEYGLYAAEATRDWHPSDYRGQNANMHLCEACLEAYEATGDERHLDRAGTIADAVVRGLVDGGDLWEHYDGAWTPDWTYNVDDPDDLFRPYGYLPGHYVEWAKLLCLLERHEPIEWRIPSAVALFERAVDVAWDDEYGGLYYAFDRDERITNREKYYWVTAEQLAAAATLAATGEPFEDWYERACEYALTTQISDSGVWWRVLGRDGSRVADTEPISPPNKTDYHVVSALVTALNSVT